MPGVLSTAIYIFKNSLVYFLHTDKSVKEVGLYEGVFVADVAIKSLLLPILNSVLSDLLCIVQVVTILYFLCTLVHISCYFMWDGISAHLFCSLTVIQAAKCSSYLWLKIFAQ